MKKIIITRKNIIKYIALLFLYLNIMAFAGAIIPALSMSYPVEKAMMRSAAAINDIYIFPLSKIFGIHNVLTTPFYAVRDKLYYTAYNMYPKYETEKETDWRAIRFLEYNTLYGPWFMKYYKSNPAMLFKNNDLVNWTDEIYSHAILISQSKPSSEYLAKFVYKAFCDVSYIYVIDRPLYFFVRDNSYNNLIKNPIEIERFKTLLDTQGQLKQIYQVKYPKISEWFYGDIGFYNNEEIYIHNSLICILANKLISNTLSCNDPLISQYINSEQEMTRYLDNPQLSTIAKKGISTQLYSNWKLNNEMKNTLNLECKIN